MRRRTYTVGEANRALPYVGAIVEELCGIHAAIEELTKRRARISPDERPARDAIRAEVQERAARQHACLAELKQIAVEMKDHALGLVDFPAVLDGRTILLCWKRGETAITHWHEAEAGYAGRQPVPGGTVDWPARTAALPSAT